MKPRRLANENFPAPSVQQLREGHDRVRRGAAYYVVFAGMANRGGIMDAISVEQLIRCPGKLIEGAENGQLAVVTKAGRPLFLAVPYDERLAGEDVHVAVAVRLYESDAVSLGRAARIAGLSTSEFIDRLGALQIPVIRYSAEELERELAAFD